MLRIDDCRANAIRLIAVGIVGLALPALGLSQWTTGSGGTIYYNGNVGIGTSTPANPLSVNGDIDIGTRLKFDTPNAFGGSSAVFGLANATGSDRFLFYDYQSSSPLMAINGESAGGGVLIGSGYINSTATPDAAPENGLAVQGYVGIGTTNPSSPLDLYSTSLNGPFIRLETNAAPNGNQFGDGIIFQHTGAANSIVLVEEPGYGDSVSFALDDSPWTRLLNIQQNGNVGIGTINPQYPLSVNGTIQAKEVIVNTGWSDYVFDPNYHLRSLDQIAAYIKKNHHLPGIPTAADVKANGISVGEVEAKLLAKVEELTLQMIQLNNENKRLKQRVAILEKR